MLLQSFGQLLVGIAIVRGVNAADRPKLQTPNLTEVRGILALLEAPILNSVVNRAALPASPELYANNASELKAYQKVREREAQKLNRFVYGKLEYPFTIPSVAPDRTSKSNVFLPGIFHQDSFSPNDNLTAFYTKSLTPLIQSANQAVGSTSIFFHLIDTPQNDTDTDAKFNIDAGLLALLSHRASIGKVVAEAKYAANVSGFTPLIQSQDADEIRVLLTNRTQEAQVLAQAASASSALASAWGTAQGLSNATTAGFVDAIQTAAASLFRQLIDITTEVEINYMLQRLN